MAHLLLDRPMQKRFESDPLFQATMLLLQERIPKATAFYAHTTELSEHHMASGALETPIRVFSSPDTPNPEVQLLSNGRYHVMITNAGGGYSRWKDLAITRWREDRTCDNWGTFCYIRDVTSREFWSTAYQPTLKRSKHFEAIFSEGRAEFRGRNHDYDTHTEIAVSPEDDIELRRVRITNRARTRRAIDVTSYAEVVLAPPAADALHPAFSNLFVQTEIIRRQRAILCTRRPRSQGEQSPWMLHLMAVHGAEIGEVSYETDRMQFIGRGNTVADPQAMSGAEGFFTGALSGSEGSVLDPIVAIRYRITLDPEESATINMVSGIGETRDAALRLVEKYQDRRLADRVFDLAWTHGQVLLRQFNASEADAQLYGRLASSIIYANASLRADPSVLIKNHRGQSGLWGYAISGDLPIVLLQIEDPANIDLVRQLVQAHAYWRLKGLAVDLVIWNEDHAGYRQLLHDQIMGLIAAGTEAKVDRSAGRHFRKTWRPDSGGGPHPDPNGRSRHHHRQPGVAGGPDQPAQSGGSCSAAPYADPNPPLRTPGSGRIASPRSDVLQRAGRIHPGWARVCHYHRARAGDAGAVGECAGQPALRHRHFRERPCLYLERECPRVPPHSLGERSRQ